MRRRFVRSTLTIVLSGIAVLCAVMLWASREGIARENASRLDTLALQVATLFESKLRDGDVITVEDLAAEVPPEWQIVLWLHDGTHLVAGPDVPADVYRAVQEIPGYGTVTIAEQPGRMESSQLASALAVIGLGLLVAVVSVVVAVRESRRLTAPLEDLADTVERMTSEGTDVRANRYGIAELDALAEALDAGAERITELLEHERSLTVDASHQLRTPLTALSMRLEEIVAADSVDVAHEEAAAALEQVERLAGVVDVLLVKRASERVPLGPLAVDDVVQQQQVEWEPAFTAAGRRLVCGGEPGLVALAARGPVAEVVSGLLENSLQHGGGTTSVAGRRLEGAMCLEVADEGPGVPEELVNRVFERGVSGGQGTGRGLARARAAAESVGGQLRLVDARSARFALFLPTPQPAGTAGAGATTLGNTQRR